MAVVGAKIMSQIHSSAQTPLDSGPLTGPTDGVSPATRTRARLSAAELSSRIQRTRLRTVTLKIGEEKVWDRDLTPAVATAFIERLGAFVRNGSDLSVLAFGYSCSLVISGCEPFANPIALQEVASSAKRQGFHVQAQTWGRWTTPDLIAEAVVTVKDSIDHMAVCVSARDLRFNGISHVTALVDAGRQHHVTVAMNLMLDDGNDWPPELLALRALNEDTMIVNAVPLYGLTQPPDGEDAGYLLDRLPRFRCRERFGLNVSPYGDVYPCLAMVGEPMFRLGNIMTDSVEQIVQVAIERPDLHALSDHGPKLLKQAAEARGLGDELPVQFADACDFHLRFIGIDSLRPVSAAASESSI